MKGIQVPGFRSFMEMGPCCLIVRLAFSMLLVVAGVFLAGPTGIAMAQPGAFALQRYDNAQGIRPGSMIGLARDPAGYLWILYPRFVQRFDGARARRFDLPGYLEDLFIDRDGRAWVTGSSGTWMLDPGRDFFQPIERVPADEVDGRGRIIQDEAGRILLVSLHRIFLFEETGRRFTDFSLPAGLQPPYAWRSATTLGDFLVLQRGEMMIRWNQSSGAIDSLLVPRARRLHWITADSLLASSWDLESYWVDFAFGTVRPVRLPVPVLQGPNRTVSIRSLAPLGDGQFLVVTREGIFTYRQADGHWARPSFGEDGHVVETSDFASEILADVEGNIWMISPEGLFRTRQPDEGFSLFRFRSGQDRFPAGIDNIRALKEDRHGRIWIATGNGFAMLDPATWDYEVFLPEEGRSDRLAFPSVRSLVLDDRYVILGPADKGIWLYDPVMRTYRRPAYADTTARRMSEGDFYDDLCPLPDGSILCMGRDAIYHLTAGNYRLSILDVPPGRENSNFGFVGPQGEVWVATMVGLHLLHPDLRYDRPIPLPPGSQLILAGTILRDGAFLFAAEGEIMTARKTAAGQVDIRPFPLSLPGKLVKGLYMDESNVLWVTSEDGIYRYEVETGRRQLFDYSDNVQGYGFNTNVILPSTDGHLYFGGINGINILRTDRFQVEPSRLQVYLESVTTGQGQPLASDGVTVLPYADRSLEATISVPYFSSAEKLLYRYRLSGYEDEWKAAGRNTTIRFASLPPGDYVLEAAASINQVDWVEAARPYRFRIRTPFWQAWWFVGGLVLTGFSALWVFVRSRNRRVTLKQEELEAEQAINYFSTRMTEYPDVDSMLWDVARNCIGRLRFEDCVIYLLDEKRGMLVQRAALGPKAPDAQRIVDPIEIPPGQGITGSVALTGIAEIVDDTMLDPRYIADDRQRNSEIAVPITAAGVVLGVIDCEHSTKRFFTQRHLSVLTTIASLVAAKLVKVQAEAGKQEAERTLMATRQQLADIEMQALRAQMNPHFIFNCLNSINRYIVKSDQATASLYLTRFAKLIRLILDNSNSRVVTLSNELEALRLYIEMESIRFEKQFTWTVDVSADIRPEQILVPPLIIQPYVENAIWHGLLHRSEAGRLSVRIARQGDEVLQCVIEDNGIGRERAAQLKSKSATGNKSLGMKLTEDRLALLGRSGVWQATVQVEDLVDPSGEPAGTRVILTLPIDE